MIKRDIKSNAGIAIGPILFIVAIMAVIAVAVSSATGGFSTVLSADKIESEVFNQASLIRNKIIKCKAEFDLRRNLSSFSGKQLCPNPDGGGFPVSLEEGSRIDELMCSSLVQVLKDSGGECCFWQDDGCENLNVVSIGDSIWEDAVPPSGMSGFKPWKYINDIKNGGGICFWIEANFKNDTVSEGFARAALKFRHSNSVADGIANYSEVIVSADKFIMWIVPPADEFKVNANCTP